MRQGGSYKVDKAGDDPKLLARTEDHEDGNRARDASGKALDIPEALDSPEAHAKQSKPAVTKKTLTEKDNASTS